MSYQKLLRRIAVELEKMDRAVQENSDYVNALETVKNPSAYNAAVGGIAMNVQSFYTGAERIFLEIAKYMDDTRPSGDQWHQDLLQQMATEGLNKRPAVISGETFRDLDALRRFRHLVRNAYSYRLENEKVLANAARLSRCFNHLSYDCLMLQQRLTDDRDETS